MTGRDSHERDDPLAALNLPNAVRARTLTLLNAIAQARTTTECTRAADRAEGFVLGIETVNAQSSASLEGVYMAFDNAATARRLEHEQ